jgi:heme/copper-type cytochrome/quinol oxidase subunit 2
VAAPFQRKDTVVIQAVFWMIAVILVIVMLVFSYQGYMQRRGLTDAHFSIICIDNVEYLYRMTGAARVVTPKIDPETLSPKNCQ